MAYDYRATRDRIFGLVRNAEGKVTEIVKTPGKMSERALLLALVEFAPNIEPSTASIALMLGTDERSVRRLLRTCETKGLLLVERRSGLRSRYSITCNPGLIVPPDTKSFRTNSPPTPDELVLAPRTIRPPKQTREADKKAGKKGVRSAPRTSRVEFPDSAEHGAIVKLYFELYESVRGAMPTFDGQDGKAVRDLLAKCGYERAAKTIEDAFRSWWGSRITIRDIAKEPSKFLGLKPDNGKGRGPVQDTGVDPYVGARAV